MQYMLMICADESRYESEDGRKELMEIVAKHTQLAQDLHAAGVPFSGERLQPASTATTVRTRKGVQDLHDGPFVETHEELGGFYIIDVPDLDAAIAWARRIPVGQEGSIEVRPIFPMK